jgi:integrative and conjugative element protein (TIGR02256 family)
VVVHQNVIDDLKTYRQFEGKDVEACGVLLGYVYEKAIEIVTYTAPQPSDARTRSGYVRGLSGHVEEATTAWEKSNGLIGYLGEWHTHPELRPFPSNRDIAASRKIATMNSFPVTGMIIGYDYGCVFVIDQNHLGNPQGFEL